MRKLPAPLRLLPLALALCAAAFGATALWAQDGPPAAPPEDTSAPVDRPQQVRADREAQQQREAIQNRERDTRNRRPAPAVQRQESIQVRGTRQLDDRQVNTASKLVITKEEMAQYGDTNIADVLKRAPGVTVGGAAGRGGGEIRMRGLGSGYTQILINGEPAPRGFSLETLAPDQLERIEVFRTATAQFSTQAVAGSINIVLKDGELPPEKVLRSGARVGTRPGASASINLNDKLAVLTYNLGVSLNQDRGQYHGQVREEAMDAQGLASFDRINRQQNRSNNEGGSVNGRLRYTLNTQDSLSAELFMRKNVFTGVFDELSSTTLGIAPRFGAAHSEIESNGSGANLRLGWTRKLNDDGAKLEARAGLNRNMRDSYSAFAGQTALGQLSLLRQTDSGASDNGRVASVKLTWPRGDGHQWVGGANLETSERREYRHQDEQSPLAAEPLVFAREAFTATVDRAAAFVQDEWDVTPRWSMYLGLRIERIRTDSDGAAAVNNSAQVLSPIAQSLWKISQSGDQVRLGLSRTFKAPGTNQLIARRFTATNNTALTPDSKGNPNLLPELATGLDLAYEKFFKSPDSPQSGQGVFSISTYFRRISGLIFSQTTQQADGRWLSMPTNLGAAKVVGLELEFKTPLRTLWASAPAIDFRLNAARNHSTVEAIPGPGNRLAAQTPVSANLGFDHRLDAQYSYGANLSYSGGGYFRRSSTQSGTQSDKRELDAYALWRIKPGSNLRISAANLLQRSTTATSLSTDANSRFGSTNSADTHASLRIGLEARFR